MEFSKNCLLFVQKKLQQKNNSTPLNLFKPNYQWRLRYLLRKVWISNMSHFSKKCLKTLFTMNWQTTCVEYCRLASGLSLSETTKNTDFIPWATITNNRLHNVISNIYWWEDIEDSTLLIRLQAKPNKIAPYLWKKYRKFSTDGCSSYQTARFNYCLIVPTMCCGQTEHGRSLAPRKNSSTWAS